MPTEARTQEEIVEELLKKATPNGDCLECHLKPSVDNRGRERHFVSVGGRYGTNWRASRLVYTVLSGEIPNNRVVMHTCDNLKCINPKHLIIGTFGDNTQDMIVKGRHKYITPNNTKLTAEQVVLIKQLRNEGLNYTSIGEQFGVCASTIMNYLRRKEDV